MATEQRNVAIICDIDLILNYYYDKIHFQEFPLKEQYLKMEFRLKFTSLNHRVASIDLKTELKHATKTDPIFKKNSLNYTLGKTLRNKLKNCNSDKEIQDLLEFNYNANSCSFNCNEYEMVKDVFKLADTL